MWCWPQFVIIGLMWQLHLKMTSDAELAFFLSVASAVLCKMPTTEDNINVATGITQKSILMGHIVIKKTLCKYIVMHVTMYEIKILLLYLELLKELMKIS